jgi:hypothetical protein
MREIKWKRRPYLSGSWLNSIGILSFTGDLQHQSVPMLELQTKTIF